MRRGGDRRVLATVLFTDIVRSTDIAVELGDVRWKELLRRHHAIVRRELKEFGGREVDTAGDGFFAIFDTPAQAVRCASACVDGVRALGVEIRAGLHTGEVEFEDGKARGVAVHLGARVMSTAGAGDVAVTGTVRDLVAGAGLVFDDRGVHELKGVPGAWHLWRLSSIDGTGVAPPLAEAEAETRRTSIVPADAARRRGLLVGGLAGLAVVAGLAAILLTREGGDDGQGRATHTAGGSAAGSVMEFDPKTGVTLRLIPDVVPEGSIANIARGEKTSIARGLGSVWVVSLDGTDLAEVDEESGELGEPVHVGFGGQSLFVEDPYVWVSVRGKLLRVSSGSGEPQDVMRAEGGALPAELPAAPGNGSVWVFADGDIVRLDDETGDVVDRLHVDADVSQIAWEAGSLWAIDDLNSELVEIDPRDGAIDQRVELNGNLDAFVVGDGSAWIVDESVGTVTPVDVESGDVRPSIQVGSEPSGIAIGLDAVWVGDLGGSEIWRIDPVTRAADPVDVGSPVGSIVADEGDHALWLVLSGERIQ